MTASLDALPAGSDRRQTLYRRAPLRTTLVIGVMGLAACGDGTSGSDTRRENAATTAADTRPPGLPTWEAREGPLELAVWVQPEHASAGEEIRLYLYATDDRGGPIDVAVAFGEREHESLPGAPTVDCVAGADPGPPRTSETTEVLSHTYREAGTYTVVATAVSANCEYSDALVIREQVVVQ